MGTKNNIKVFILDDHQLVRSGLKAMLSSYNHIEIVGEGFDAEDLIIKLKQYNVDVLLLDVFLPDTNGLKLAREVCGAVQKIKIIMVSSNYDEEMVLGAFQNGALGYLHKDVSAEELVDAIEEVMEKREYISEEIRKSLSNTFIKRARYGDKYSQSKLTCLTEREIEIIKYLAQGLISKEIASEMNVSHRTVEAHKRNILEKLELRSITDVIIFAIKNKIIVV